MLVLFIVKSRDMYRNPPTSFVYLYCNYMILSCLMRICDHLKSGYSALISMYSSVNYSDFVH